MWVCVIYRVPLRAQSIGVSRRKTVGESVVMNSRYNTHTHRTLFKNKMKRHPARCRIQRSESELQIVRRQADRRNRWTNLADILTIRPKDQADDSEFEFQHHLTDIWLTI